MHVAAATKLTCYDDAAIARITSVIVHRWRTHVRVEFEHAVIELMFFFTSSAIGW